MAAYVIFEAKALHDAEKLAEYKQAAGPIIEQHGGRFLIGRGKIRVIEGDPFEYAVCLLFDSYEQAEAWYDSPEYQAVKKIRDGAVDVNAIIVDGLD